MARFLPTIFRPIPYSPLGLTTYNSFKLGLPLCQAAAITRQNHTLGPKGAIDYVQGQSPEPRIREYFYYIDHQGMLFLDDARMKNFTSCFKDIKFLQFFYSRLRVNETDRYEHFPFLSPCGRERNYVRCDDLPIVFTHLIDSENETVTDKQQEQQQQQEYRLTYNHGDRKLMTYPFQPSEVCMEAETGRLYHPAPERVGKVGLIRTHLALSLSRSFVFGDGEERAPTHLLWAGQEVELSQNVSRTLKELDALRKYSLGLNSQEN